MARNGLLANHGQKPTLFTRQGRQQNACQKCHFQLLSQQLMLSVSLHNRIAAHLSRTSVMKSVESLKRLSSVLQDLFYFSSFVGLGCFILFSFNSYWGVVFKLQVPVSCPEEAVWKGYPWL